MGLLTRLATTGVRAAARAAAVDNTRTPKAGSANVYYSTPGVPQTPAWDGLTAITNGYEQSLYVMRCARLTAEKIASFPFRAGADPDKPADHNPAAPLAQLLGPGRPGSMGGPNPQWSSRSMWIWSIVQRLICGRMAWETVNVPGSNQIAALWPLVAPFIQPIPSAGGTRYFDGFRYALPTGYVEYRAEQLFYSWRPAQLDPRQPESVLQAAALPVSLQIALQKYLWALAKNGMVGRTLVVTPSFEEATAEAAFRSQFLAEFAGYDNAGKTMFATLDEDDAGAGRTAASQAYSRQSVQALKLDTSPTDAQALELLQDMRQVIREAFGTPKSKLADATDSTFENAEQDDQNWLLDTIIPLARELQDDINLHLAPRLGQDVGFFDFSAATALKPVAVFAPIAPDNAYKAGLITPDDWRTDVGLPTLGEGGDKLISATQAAIETPVPPQNEDATNANMPAGLSGGRSADTLIAAGLVVKALDTGRVLLLQRALDPTDPASGMWEFPGGHIEPGEDPLAAAVREWQEETGCALPAGKVGGSWTSPNGVYRGFVYLVGSEEAVCINLDHEDRHVLNPDDPDGDGIEVVAWWNPAVLPGMTALRPEARKGTDWSLLGTADADLASLERAAGTARHPVATERLMEYWSHGDGAAKIRWGESGDFDRCRENLGKYVQRPDELAGLCANLHHRATGFWPGHAPSEQHRDTLTEGSSSGLLLPKGPLPTPGPHVFTPSKANRRKCGVCGKTVTAALHHGTGVRGFDVVEPRDAHGRWTGGAASDAENLTRAISDFKPRNFAGDNDAERAHSATQWANSNLAHDFTADQRNAIGYYSSDGFADINASLRRGDTPDEVSAIDSAMRPIPEDLQVVRQFASLSDKDIAVLQNAGGKYLSDDGYISTSLHGLPFTSNGVATLHIALPKGTPAVWVDPISEHRGENELLLSRGQRLWIERVTKDPSGHYDLYAIAVPAAKEANGSGERHVDASGADGRLRVQGGRRGESRPEGGRRTREEAGRRNSQVAEALDLAGLRHAGPEGHHHTPTGHLTGLANRTRRLVDEHATSAETDLTAALRDLFDKQAKATLSRLQGRRGQQMMRSAGLRATPQPPEEPPPAPEGQPVVLDVAAVYDLAHWIEATQQAVNPVFAALRDRTTARLAKDLHPGVPVYQQAVAAAEQALAGRASRLADTVSQTTYQEIARALADGVANGEGVQALAARVRAVFDQASQSRAETIARTEVMSGVNTAQNAYAEALPTGIVGAKQWLATPDARTRETHREANGQRRDIGQPFMVGGVPMQHPGDPAAPPDEVINCRCTTLYVPARAAKSIAAAVPETAVA